MGLVTAANGLDRYSRAGACVSKRYARVPWEMKRVANYRNRRCFPLRTAQNLTYADPLETLPTLSLRPLFLRSVPYQPTMSSNTRSKGKAPSKELKQAQEEVDVSFSLGMFVCVCCPVTCVDLTSHDNRCHTRQGICVHSTFTCKVPAIRRVCHVISAYAFQLHRSPRCSAVL